jgi:nucleoside-diphosphate-sugar epimerase
MIQGKTILITGHTGLIGSALYEQLRPWNNVRGEARTSKACSILNGVDKIPEPDFIIHAAGYAQPARFMEDPRGTLKLNTHKLSALIDSLKPGAKLLFLSSSEVYSGSTKYSHTEDDIGSTTPSHPRAPYIEGKRCGEAICHVARNSGVDVVIARVSSVYGPGFGRDDTRVLPQFVRMAVEEGHVMPKDGGPARRGWLYVDDCVEMLLNILEYGTQAVYNVGGTEECSVAGIAKKVASAADCTWRLPRNTGDASQGAPSHVKLDISRYCREFGAPSLMTLDDGLKLTVNWYRRTYDAPVAAKTA